MESRDWCIDHRELTLYEDRILGNGCCATIYAGKWRFLDVAIKKFDPDCQPKERRFLKKELDILVKMHHPHVLQVLGVCWNPFMLVLEYMPKGNLRQNIQHYRTRPWFTTFYKKRKWSLQLCLGLIYLHERKPEYVIHRDIKPTNLLIDQNENLKIADFGLSKLIQASILLPTLSLEGNLHLLDEKMTHTIGTPFFAAPEIFVSKTGKYDSSVDIWSLGCTLFEIWENESISAFCDMDALYIGEWKPMFWKCPRQIRPIIRACISKNPQERPDARTVLQFFQSLSLWKSVWYTTTL